MICVVTSTSSALPHTYRHTQICIQFTCRLVVTPAQLLTVCQTQTCPWVKSIFHCRHRHHYPLHFSVSVLSSSLSLFLPIKLSSSTLSHLLCITTSPLPPSLSLPCRWDVVSMFFLYRTLPQAASFCTYTHKAAVHQVHAFLL